MIISCDRKSGLSAHFVISLLYYISFLCMTIHSKCIKKFIMSDKLTFNENEGQKDSTKTKYIDPLEGVSGLKLKFGDKLVDPDDKRVRHPHSRVNIQPFPTHKTDNGTSSPNSSGLLQGGDHRPKLEQDKQLK